MESVTPPRGVANSGLLDLLLEDDEDYAGPSGARAASPKQTAATANPPPSQQKQQQLRPLTLTRVPLTPLRVALPPTDAFPPLSPLRPQLQPPSPTTAKPPSSQKPPQQQQQQRQCPSDELCTELRNARAIDESLRGLWVGEMMVQQQQQQQPAADAFRRQMDAAADVATAVLAGRAELFEDKGEACSDLDDDDEGYFSAEDMEDQRHQ